MRSLGLLRALLVIVVLGAWAVPLFAAGEESHGSPNPLEIRYDTAIWSIVVRRSR